MIAPYLARLGLTSGQACTLSLGLVLGGVLLTVSVPPVWNREAAAAAAPAAVAAAPLPGGTLTGLVPEPAAVPSPAPAVAARPAPVAAPVQPAAVAAAPSPAPAPAPAPAAMPSAAPAPVELTVVEGTFSTSDPTTVGVPEDGLPVGARVGSPVETSYVRLDGTGTVLRLAVVDEPAATFGTAQVAACRTTSDDWTGERPRPAVPYDEKACAPGVPGDDGYSFDLARFPDRSDLRGFALVARPASPTATFRLTLTPPRSTP